ncbi:MAG: hypothetical protein IKQ76_00075 [Bacteroidales bacterium]|nr:hypothetical protein [Bacteroidales bacterium]
MTPRFLNTLPLLGVLLLAACGPASRTDALLNDVESYINDAPDSARAVLQALDTTELVTRRLRARYSLLRTMAQDKCYDDITIPGLLDDAAWFERHGTPDERLKLWFYRGCVQLRLKDNNEAALAFSRAESFADQVQDQHALGLLYLAMQNVYMNVYNPAREQEYAEKAVDVFKRTDDPLTGHALGILAVAYQDQKKWAQADSVYQEARPFFESVPSRGNVFYSKYAALKVLQPEKDPEGAIELLDRYRELTGSFGVTEAGVYAYANELLGRRQIADRYISVLRNISEENASYSAMVWLADIDELRGDYGTALWERKMLYSKEKKIIQEALDDSVTQTLREDASRQAKDARVKIQRIWILAGGVFFALLSAFLLLLLRKSKVEAERDRLVNLREQMQEELDRVQEENAEKTELLSGQEDRIREMEEHVAREREIYTRERVKRLRQLGELRSTFWWRDHGWMREAEAIQRIKKEISYVYQTDNDGAALIRRLDDELDGAISRLRKGLHLRGKPQEVLFLCCCILDLEPEMIAEILDMSRTNVYVKRSRLRARIRELNDPLLTVLVEKQ